jgi:hypothetical protein
MQFYYDDDYVTSLRVTCAGLRQRLGATAASIAATEDWLADTYDRVARERPRDAERLRDAARRARRFAAEERERAAVYGGSAEYQDPAESTT